VIDVLLIFVTMLLILALAAGIAVYVAFPHRGEDVPRAAWLGRALRRGVQSLPTLDDAEDGETRELSLLAGRSGRE